MRDADFRRWITWVTNAINQPRIIDSGTDGIWTYRKWSDGTSECWGEFTGSYTGSTAWGSSYWMSPYNQLSFPSGLFIAKPVITMARSGGVESFAGYASASKDGITNMYTMRPATASAGTYQIAFHAIGRWKE